jgi:quinoprotein glucose dehydrogenase
MRWTLIAGAGLLVTAGYAAGQSPQSVDWPRVGNDPGCMRYSPLEQINRDTVRRLKPAWTYHTGELKGRVGKTIECTPIVIEGVMYVTTGYLRVVALDAATGKELWQFDPLKDHPSAHEPMSGGVNRGCAYWSDGHAGGQRRIIHGTADGRLFSLDAQSGKLDLKFADAGILDLRKGLEAKFAALGYGPTSAPAIWKDTVIVGVSCGEGPGIEAPGDIRAFDVRTGKDVWRFHTVPHPGEFGHDTWEADSWKDRGGANAWGGFSVDAGRGMVFAGLGSAAFDFYGGDRHGANLFANCTIALDAKTGERRWHFQTLHHDLWDHDLPVYPNLVTVNRDGKPVDAVAQVTKTGYLFLFERETGKPLFDIKEQPVPGSDVPGEQAWPTQPIPVKPPPFSAQSLDESNLTDIGEANRASALAQLRKIRGGPAFNPPSRQGTVVIPGFHGGANWSGASFDPTTGLLYVNSNNVPNITTLVERRTGRRARYGPFGTTGYHRFLDHEGYPAIKPPWGVLNAINLVTGEFAWRVPLGEHVELTSRGIPRTGTETFGGSIVTAGGLVFIAGTKDERIHAFDKKTGELLWEHSLPAGGYATPSTYLVNGRQYVVIAAGGAGKLETKAGDAFVAFSLPAEQEISGVGIALKKEGEHLLVGALVPDGAAASSHAIQVGDRLIAVGQENGPDVPVTGRSILQVVPLVRGPKGTSVRLTIVPSNKDDTQAHVVTLVRAELKNLARSGNNALPTRKPFLRWGDGALLKRGTNAPNIQLAPFKKQSPEHLADYAGKIVVLEFWDVSCEGCEAAMAELQSYADKYPEWKDRVVLIGASDINHEEDAVVKRVKSKGWDKIHHVRIGAEAMKAYHVNALPTVYVIDKQEKIVDSGNAIDVPAVVNRLLRSGG